MDDESLKIRNILDEIKMNMQACRSEEERKKLEELLNAMENIDFQMLCSSDCENITPPSTPKRRKVSRGGSENNDPVVDKHQKRLEEVERQIEVLKTALDIIYAWENSNFKKFISKNEKKRRNVISRIPFIKRINENAQSLPLWVGAENQPAPPLCGALEAEEGYVAKVGDMVAALVRQNKGENWILAEVTAYDPTKKEYKVDDIYEEPKAEQILCWNKVIPLPKYRANPESNPEAIFPKNSTVLALYPGTTCFYNAVVVESPTKSTEPYQLLFEDENHESGYSSPIPVHQRYVVHYGVDSTEEETEESDK